MLSNYQTSHGKDLKNRKWANCKIFHLDLTLFFQARCIGPEESSNAKVLSKPTLSLCGWWSGGPFMNLVRKFSDRFAAWLEEIRAVANRKMLVTICCQIGGFVAVGDLLVFHWQKWFESNFDDVVQSCLVCLLIGHGKGGGRQGCLVGLMNL